MYLIAGMACGVLGGLRFQLTKSSIYQGPCEPTQTSFIGLGMRQSWLCLVPVQWWMWFVFKCWEGVWSCHQQGSLSNKVLGVLDGLLSQLTKISIYQGIQEANVDFLLWSRLEVFVAVDCTRRVGMRFISLQESRVELQPNRVPFQIKCMEVAKNIKPSEL